MKINLGTDHKSIGKKLEVLPGMNQNLAKDLIALGITQISDLKNRDPEELYNTSNKIAGQVQDRSLLYILRCAVYYASVQKRDPRKLDWHYWKD